MSKMELLATIRPKQDAFVSILIRLRGDLHQELMKIKTKTNIPMADQTLIFVADGIREYRNINTEGDYSIIHGISTLLGGKLGYAKRSHFSVNIPSQLLEDLNAISVETGLSRTRIIDWMVEDGVGKYRRMEKVA